MDESNACLPAGKGEGEDTPRLAIGYGTDAQKIIHFQSLGPQSKGVTDFLKVFVSNVYVDMHGLPQSSPLPALRSKDPARAAAASMVALPVNAGWNSFLCALTVVQGG